MKPFAFDPQACALLIVDVLVDFCSPTGSTARHGTPNSQMQALPAKINAFVKSLEGSRVLLVNVIVISDLVATRDNNADDAQYALRYMDAYVGFVMDSAQVKQVLGVSVGLGRRLEGKAALVTGAASGIGQATAIQFAAEGARVTLVDLNEEGLRDTQTRIGESGGVSILVKCDLTLADAVETAVAAAVKAWGDLHVVVNCAGGSGRRYGDGPVHACSIEGWEQTLSLNLTSLFLVCKYAVPALLTTRGSIVNVSSVLGLVGGDEDFATHAYAASKSGIIGLSRAMASYYAAQGLRVNVIAPGLIATPMSRRAQSDEHILGRLPQLQPLSGAMGEPEDVAAAAVFLASDEAKFITGAVLTVDGGWTVR